MYPYPLRPRPRRRLTQIAALIVGILTGIYLLYDGWFHVAEFRAAQSWPTVTGKVLKTEVIDDFNTELGANYIPVVTYQYQVEDNTYTSQRVDFSYGNSRVLNEAGAQASIRAYVPGKPVVVYYNPAQPWIAVLNRLDFDSGATVSTVFFGLICLALSASLGFIYMRSSQKIIR